jgi:hypothetical protein
LIEKKSKSKKSNSENTNNEINIKDIEKVLNEL